MLQHQKKSGKNNANFGQHHITQGPSKFHFTIPLFIGLFILFATTLLPCIKFHKLFGLI